MKRTIILLAVVNLCIVNIIMASGGTMSGSGTSDSPYLVDDYDDLKAIGTGSYSLSLVYSLTGDIDASASSTEGGFSPIGSLSPQFTGTFLGNNHVISNLYISESSTSGVGLFGVVYGSGAKISDLGVTDADITGAQGTGALAGIIYGSEISNCYCSGKVTGTTYVGGLIGLSYSGGDLTGCYTTAMVVTGEDGAGGLIGANYSGSITSCYTTATDSVNGTGEYAGGLVGCHYNTDGTITNSYSEAVVTGAKTVGGFVGETNGTISDCYSTGAATCSSKRTGGFAGSNYISGGIGIIRNCHSSGVVTSPADYVGGIAGSNTGSIISCYFTGSVVGDDYTGGIAGYNGDDGDVDSSYITSVVTIEGTGSYAGGVVGWNYGDIKNCHSEGTISVAESRAGGVAGINCGNVTNCYSEGTVSTSNGYAGGVAGENGSVISESHSSGSVSGINLVGGLVGDMSDTSSVKNCYSSCTVSGTYRLGGLIGRVTGTTCYVEDSYCTGSVTGLSGFVGGLIGDNSGGNITDCNCSGAISSGPLTEEYYGSTYQDGKYSCSAGLVGYNTGTITGCTNTSLIDGDGKMIGGVVGWNVGGTISNCSHTVGTITNSDYVQTGGVAGYNTNGTIEYCYNSADIYAKGQVGGVTGQNYGTVISCYNRGSINGTTSGYSYFGGVAGINVGSISDCYTTGNMTNITDCSNIAGFAGYNNSGTIEDCFWDTDSAGITTGIAKGTTTGVTGRTSAEMKTNDTFLDAGWDASIWYMDSDYNDGYPYLFWEVESGTSLPVVLSLFTAQLSGASVVLNWETSTEVNNYGFDIQRRYASGEDTSSWSKLEFVEGNGATNSTQSYTYIDSILPSAELVHYRLKQIDDDGTYTYSKIITVDISTVTGIDDNECLPTEYNLSQNYPNPFNPTTKIEYSLVSSSYVSLKVYDMLGREVMTLVDKTQSAGNYEVELNGSELASGIYIYRLTAGDYISVKKMVLLK